MTRLTGLGSTGRIRRLLEKITANRKMKDVLFRYIFKDREALLELYNALNRSDFDNPEDLQVTTFENIIYMTMKEDTAFLIANTLNLYEHQSSINPNMPICGFIYLAQQYERLIRKTDMNIYGRERVKLPTPRYIVFYNGEDKVSDRSELRLSEAFIVPDEQPAVEVIATMININYGHNMELLEKCRPLQQYSYFINKIREYQSQGHGYERAVELAVNHCIEENILRELLTDHKAEVEKMLLTEYDPKKHIRLERKEAKEEGREEGIKEGREIENISMIRKNMRRGISAKEIADFIGNEEAYVISVMELIIKYQDRTDQEIAELIRK